MIIEHKFQMKNLPVKLQYVKKTEDLFNNFIKLTNLYLFHFHNLNGLQQTRNEAYFN